MSAAADQTEQELFFVEQYRRMDTEEIVSLRQSGLSEVARRAADRVLSERNVGAVELGAIVEQQQSESGPLDRKWISGRKELPFEAKKTVLRSFLGLEPLWRVYWLYAVIFSTVVLGPLLMIGASGSRLTAFFTTVFVAAYAVWILVSLWRCAKNVTPGYVWCGALVQALVILYAIGGAGLIVSVAVR